MAIGVEPTEYQGKKRLPAIDGAVMVEGLEERTGADIIVSPFSAPFSTDTLLGSHLERGAQLVQSKIGSDLASSVGDRLMEAGTRMEAASGHAESSKWSVQHALLFSGTLFWDADDLAIIDGRPCPGGSPTLFWSVQTSLDMWADRFGPVYHLHNARLIEGWVKRRELRLKQYAQEPRKTYFPTVESWDVMPPESDPFQVIVKASWPERILASLVGPALAKPILARTGSLAFALYYITDPQTPKAKNKVPGWGPGVQAKVLARLGLRRGQTIEVLEGEGELS